MNGTYVSRPTHHPFIPIHNIMCTHFSPFIRGWENARAKSDDQTTVGMDQNEWKIHASRWIQSALIGLSTSARMWQAHPLHARSGTSRPRFPHSNTTTRASSSVGVPSKLIVSRSSFLLACDLFRCKEPERYTVSRDLCSGLSCSDKFLCIVNNAKVIRNMYV